MPGSGMGHSERGRRADRTRWGTKPLDLTQVAGRASSEEPEEQRGSSVARSSSQTRSLSRGRACGATPSWWGGYDSSSDVEDDVGRSRSATPSQRRRRQAELLRYPSARLLVRSPSKLCGLTGLPRMAGHLWRICCSHVRNVLAFQGKIAGAVGVGRSCGRWHHTAEEPFLRLPARLVNMRNHGAGCMHPSDKQRTTKL